MKQWKNFWQDHHFSCCSTSYFQLQLLSVFPSSLVIIFPRRGHRCCESVSCLSLRGGEVYQPVLVLEKISLLQPDSRKWVLTITPSLFVKLHDTVCECVTSVRGISKTISLKCGGGGWRGCTLRLNGGLLSSLWRQEDWQLPKDDTRWCLKDIIQPLQLHLHTTQARLWSIKVKPTQRMTLWSLCLLLCLGKELLTAFVDFCCETPLRTRRVIHINLMWSTRMWVSTANAVYMNKNRGNGTVFSSLPPE